MNTVPGPEVGTAASVVKGKEAVLLYSCPSNTRSRVCILQGVINVGWERKYSSCQATLGCAGKRGRTHACMCKGEGVGQH